MAATGPIHGCPVACEFALQTRGTSPRFLRSPAAWEFAAANSFLDWRVLIPLFQSETPSIKGASLWLGEEGWPLE